MATHRKRKNFIKVIKDVHGAWVINEEAISDIFVDFYSRLFTTSCPTNLERVQEGVQTVVSDYMNEALTRPYVREEVDVAIKQMAPLKAPGPDDMPPLFFQTFWSDWFGCFRGCAFLSQFRYNFKVHQSYFYHFDPKGKKS